jgi:hypothetical protein
MASRTKGLDAKRAAHAKGREHEREIAQIPNRLRAEYEALTERLMEHDLPIDGSRPTGEAGKLWDQRLAVKEKLDGPWEERYRKAQNETARAESELHRYIGDHLGELVSEIEPDALAARDRVVERADDLDQAFAEWSEVEHRVTSLLAAVPGADPRDVPRLPGDGLRAELRRLRGAEIPPPLPRSLFAEEAPDPTVTASGIGTVGPAD